LNGNAFNDDKFAVDTSALAPPLQRACATPHMSLGEFLITVSNLANQQGKGKENTEITMSQLQQLTQDS
jgi:hypothetical protein